MPDVQSRFTSAPNFDLPPFRTVFDFDAMHPDLTTAHRRVGIQVNTQIQPVASRPFGVTSGEPEYHFYVAHQCVFSPDGIWTADDAHSKGWYVQSYRFESYTIDDSGKPLTDAVLVQSVPETKVCTDTYSSSLSQSISGNLGFMGDAPMAGIAGSVSWSDSHSFEVSDVTMLNGSDKPGAAPGTDILMSMRDSVASRGGFPTYYVNLDYPAKLATATFQPVVLELWRMPRKLSSTFRLEVTVTCKLAFMRVTDTNDTSWERDWDLHSEQTVYECPYPLPPL